MKIKFTSDAYVNGELFAKKNEVKDIEPETSAQRWIRRGHVIDEGKNPEVKEEEIKDDKVSLDDMKKKELLNFAESKGVEIPEDVKKVEEIREFLKETEATIEDAF